MGKQRTKIDTFIGFAYGSYFKTGYVVVFKFTEDFEHFYEGLQKKYGKDICGRYIPTTEMDEHFDALCKKCEENKIADDIYKYHVKDLTSIMKEIVGSEKCKHFQQKKQSDEKKTTTQKKPLKKPTKKQEKNDEDISDEEAPVKKEVKKETKKKSKIDKKKDESDDEVPKKKEVKEKDEEKSDSETENDAGDDTEEDDE